MNLKQIAKKNMYDKVLLFFANNESLWALFLPLVEAIGLFRDQNKDLVKLMEQQAQEVKGVTDDKDAKLKAAISLTVKAARKARAWAHKSGNLILENLFNVRADDFTHVPEADALTKLNEVHEALNDNKTDLAAYLITDSDITAIGTAIDDFAAAKAAPGNTESSKQAGTEGIEDMMHDMDTELEVIDDLLINQYEADEPNLVEQYRNDRKIDTVGVHHTRIEAHAEYTDGTGNAEGVQLYVVEPKKTAVSDIDGNLVTPNMKPGTYHVEISGSNIESQNMIVKVKRGETVKLILKVVKK
jgi:hypothetical protein